MKVLFIIVCMLVSMDFSFAACWGENVDEVVAKENEVNTPGKKLKPGDPSPDFLAVDTSGRKFSLKNLKGKYVYIDLWATWCSPCKAEIPHLQRLERLFKRKRIVFVSISCDDDREAWLNYLRRNKMGGIQLNFDGTTHEQIARNLGSAREVVSRTLKSFEKDGIVALSRGTVTILDVKKLRGICRMRR